MRVSIADLASLPSGELGTPLLSRVAEAALNSIRLALRSSADRLGINANMVGELAPACLASAWSEF